MMSRNVVTPAIALTTELSQQAVGGTENIRVRVYIFGYPSNAEQYIRRQFRQVKQELDKSGVIAADTAGGCRQNFAEPCIVR